MNLNAKNHLILPSLPPQRFAESPYMHRTTLTLNLHVVLALALLVAFSTTAEGTKLYVTDTGNQQLFEASPANASTMLIGNFGVSGFMSGLAYDAVNDILYGANVAPATTFIPGTLYTINQTTGHASLVGSFGTGITVMNALALQANTGALFGGGGDLGSPNQLFRIDTATGQASRVGPLGTDGFVTGLSFHPVTGMLYASIFPSGLGGPRLLATVDTSTGTASVIGQLQPYITGISFQPDTNVLFGVTNGGGGPNKALYTIDVSTALTTLVGSLSLSNPLDIQFVPEPTACQYIILLTLIWHSRRHNGCQASRRD